MAVAAASVAVVAAVLTVLGAGCSWSLVNAMRGDASAAVAQAGSIEGLRSLQRALLSRIGAAAAFRPSEAGPSPLLRAVISKAEEKGIRFRSLRSGGAKDPVFEFIFSGAFRPAAAFVGEIEAGLPFAEIERVSLRSRADAGPGKKESPLLTVFLKAPVRPADEAKQAFAFRRVARDPMEPLNLGPEPTPDASMMPILSGIVWDPQKPLAILVNPRNGETKLLSAGEGDAALKVISISQTAADVSVQGRRTILELPGNAR